MDSALKSISRPNTRRAADQLSCQMRWPCLGWSAPHSLWQGCRSDLNREGFAIYRAYSARTQGGASRPPRNTHLRRSILSNILITGGAGFIGKRLALSLATAGHKVGVLDTMHSQVHSEPAATLAELDAAGVAFHRGDVRDGGAILASIQEVSASTVVHLAAETGTGQSYDLPAHYCEVNITGTAKLIEAVRAARAGGLDVGRVVLAGSRAVYGEGACLTSEGTVVTAVPRIAEDMATGDFAPKDAFGRPLTPTASQAATTVPAPASVYASTKLMQEYILRQGLEPDGIECAILRLQNVYGAGQSLANPYTGVLSIFTRQLQDGHTLNLFEDGYMVRDFVHVSDVVSALQSLCETDNLPRIAIDIGTGKGASLLEVAKLIMTHLGVSGERFQISGEFRPGDIRYAVADISAAQSQLSWAPKIGLDEGLAELVNWAKETI